MPLGRPWPTEDQAYFLLSLSRTLERVVNLKAKLIQAFRDARRAINMRQVEYLPTYHQRRDTVHQLALGSSNEKFVHMNVNKLVKKAAGVEARQRVSASLPQQAMLIVCQDLATKAMHGASDHHEGYSSGGRGGKSTTNDMLALDIRKIQRAGRLTPGQSFGWQWTRGGDEIGSINMRTATDCVTLTYRNRSISEDWQDMNYPVRLTWTACNYGGYRAWWLCPAVGCGRRVSEKKFRY